MEDKLNKAKQEYVIITQNINELQARLNNLLILKERKAGIIEFIEQELKEKNEKSKDES